MSQSADLTAYKAALAEKDKGKKKKRAKVYHMKSVDRQVDNAMGRFQHDHPYVAASIEIPTAVGLLAAGAQKAGIPAFAVLSPLREVPILGRIYDAVATGTYALIRRL